jgi:hypothetical protein
MVTRAERRRHRLANKAATVQEASLRVVVGDLCFRAFDAIVRPPWQLALGVQSSRCWLWRHRLRRARTAGPSRPRQPAMRLSRKPQTRARSLLAIRPAAKGLSVTRDGVSRCATRPVLRIRFASKERIANRELRTGPCPARLPPTSLHRPREGNRLPSDGTPCSRFTWGLAAALRRTG